jgi:hypothetical protein
MCCSLVESFGKRIAHMRKTMRCARLCVKFYFLSAVKIHIGSDVLNHSATCCWCTKYKIWRIASNQDLPISFEFISQTIGRTLTLTPWCQNPKVHHRIHESPLTIPVLNQVNPLHTPPADLPKIHSNPILPSTSRSFKWSLSFGLSHQNPAHVSPLSHACHMPRPPHSPWFYLSNNIWWWV